MLTFKEFLNESKNIKIHELHPDDSKRYANTVTVSPEELKTIIKKIDELKLAKKLTSLDWSQESDFEYEASSEAFDLLNL